MEESGISQHTEYLFLLSQCLKSFAHAHRNGKTTTHAYAGVHRTERSGTAERVAPDISGDHKVFSLSHRIEKAAVGTSGAERRRARNGLYAYLFHFGFYAEEHLPQPLRIQLIKIAHKFLADAVNSSSFDLLFHDPFQLFYHVEFLHALRKLPDQPHRKRVCQPQLQE